MKTVICLLLLCSMCMASDLPPLPEGVTPQAVQAQLNQMQEAYNLYSQVNTLSSKFTYEVRDPKGKVVQNYKVEMAWAGKNKTRCRIELITGTTYYWSVEEIYNTGVTWTYTNAPTGRLGTIDADVDGQRTPHPMFGTVIQEFKRAYSAGKYPLRDIEYTHYLTNLDTAKYPMSTAYVCLGSFDWVMAFIDEKTSLPQVIWRNEYHYDGHETIKFSGWKVDDKRRPYPSDMTYDCRVAGKVVATLHLTIQDMVQTVPDGTFLFPKEFPQLTHVVRDGQPESQYDVPLDEPLDEVK